MLSASSKLLVAAAVIVLAAETAAGSESRPLTPLALATASNAIVIGRVEAITAGRDPMTGGIYTYVTLQPSAILKGTFGAGPVVIKQLGGVIGDEGLAVAGQACFVVGEEVLLFLEARPRDRTLYTSALWQGKWTIEADPVTGERLAFKREPDTDAAVMVDRVSTLTADLERVGAYGAPAENLSVAPEETPRGASPFVLNNPPIRWSAPSVPVHVDTGAQAGLAGGGIAETAAALAQWNAAGSSLTLVSGSRLAPRCLSAGAGTPAILVTFNDPCGEISADGSLLAVASFFYSLSGGQVVGGRFFYPISDVVITTSANVEVRPFLANSPCFRSTIAHELGHAIGLDHSSDPSALMYFAETGACFGGPVPLAPDDLAGLFTIYPGGGVGGAPGQPTITSASALGTILNIAWTGGAGAAPTTHRLDFFAGAAPVASITVGAATTVAIPIPPGTQGSFSVRVTPFNGLTPGPVSAAFPFTIGGSGCASPPASPVVSGGVANGIATVSWPQVAGATSYIASAGTTPGSSNLFPTTNVGLSNMLSGGGLPPGFQAYVRVIAVNGCGQSAPTDFLVR